MSVFREFDQAALDREYSPSSRVGDIAPFLRDYARLSAAARAALTVRTDLAYGGSPAERLDLFPAARPGAPLHVFIHGGYWQELSKTDSSFAAPGFVAAGAAFAAIGYALAPAANLDEIVRQCRAAIAWLWRQAPAYGYDRERIFVSGHSAGAHLAAMLLATDWAGAFGAPPEIIKGATLVSGVYELEPIRLSYVNGPLQLDREAARRNSPLLQPPRAACPVILTYGENETGEFKRQTEAYQALCSARNVQVNLVPMPGFHHFDVVLALGDAKTALGRAVFEQMSLRAGG